MKHWPVLLALVLVLVAGIVAVRRGTGGPGPAPVPAVGSTPGASPPATGSGSSEAGSGQTPVPTPVKAVPMGALKCILVPDRGAVRGTLVVLDAADVSEASKPASGDGRVELLVEKLTPGAKRIVFISEQTHGGATAEVTIASSAVAEATIPLQSAGTLKGKVVDSLQRPLPGARVEVVHPSLFSPRAPGKAPVSVWTGGGGRSGGRAGGTPRVAISYTRSLMSDGTVQFSITTDSDGEFELDGVTLPSVELGVKYKDVRVVRACVRDGENLLILPVVLEEPVRDLKAEQMQAAIQSLLNQMAVHHDNPEPYAAQLRDLLRNVVSEAQITPKQRDELNKAIESIGRPEQKR